MVKVLIVLKVILIFIIVVMIFIYINPVFGGRASRKDKEDYKKRAENYIKGKFVYPAQYILKGESYDNSVSNRGKSPKVKLPLIKPSINKTNIGEFTVTWLGHSSLLIQMHGMNILIDPVFSKRPSPVSFVGPKRFTEPPISIEELPEIDIVLISHDHYDHLDMKSIKKLDNKVKRYIVPLGVEKHLERWKVDKDKIKNMAWWEEIQINGLTIACTPSRHFSNRSVKDMTATLYASWVLKDEKYQIYESGDGGFGGHFEEIHKKYGEFDLAIMECGQYNMRWHDIHMFPEESVKAGNILGAKITMPIHWGTFILSSHGWDDSVERFLKASSEMGNEVITPKIGETVNLDKYTDYQEKWWRYYQ